MVERNKKEEERQPPPCEFWLFHQTQQLFSMRKRVELHRKMPQNLLESTTANRQYRSLPRDARVP